MILVGPTSHVCSFYLKCFSSDVSSIILHFPLVRIMVCDCEVSDATHVTVYVLGKG